MVQQLLIAFYYYDYQLSKARRKFGVQVSTFNVTCVFVTGNWFRFQWQPIGLSRHLQQSAGNCRREILLL